MLIGPDMDLNALAHEMGQTQFDKPLPMPELCCFQHYLVTDIEDSLA